MLKYCAVLLPFLLGCSILKPIVGLSADEKDRLTDYLSRGIAYYDSGKYAQAEQQFRKAVAIDEGDIDANLGLAWSLLYQNSVPKLEEAEKQMIVARGLDDEDFRVHYGLGNVYYAKGRLCQQQLDIWKLRAPLADPGRDPIKEKTDERDRYLEEAVANYHRALELNKDYPYALSGLGQIAALRGDNEAALRFLFTYLDKAEETRRFYEEYKLRVEDPESLDRVTRKIQGNEKKESDVRTLVADLLYKKGEYEGALTQLNRVLEIQPESAQAYLNRGQCYANLGDYRQAAVDVETFLKKATKLGDSTVEDAHRLLGEYRSKATESGAAKGGR
ncbi:MAG: tetratricopeptide repeat protein [Planctomycetes bacterium]|nr:tetratricopeptide repeat protein [Planctomycetota bacterium]MBI3846782.1 tetratricopeptide repeat protein [Planctomycetota bacterium]